MRGARSRRCASASCRRTYQAKFLGDNARRLYKIDPPNKFIRDRVTEIERPDWWPTEEEVKAALKPEASVLQRRAEFSPGVGRWPLNRRGQSAMAKKRFPVFDSDSHVVEPPELWEKYLEPEYRTLGKHALWREEGKPAPISRSTARSSATR